MAQYICVVPLNGKQQYLKNQTYEFDPGEYPKDKDGNLDKHFELVGNPDAVDESDEASLIRVRLDALGVKYHPATGLEKLRNKLAVAQS